MGEGPCDASKFPGIAARCRAAALSLCRVPLLFILFCFGRARVPALCVRACSRRPAPARGWVVVAGTLACRHHLCFHPIGVPVRWTLCALSLQCRASVVDPTVCA